MTLEAKLTGPYKDNDIHIREFQKIIPHIDMEKLIGARRSTILMERGVEKGRQVNYGRIVKGKESEKLFQGPVEVHGWFPDGKKLLMSYGTPEKMTGKYQAREPFRESLFTCDIDGNLEFLDVLTNNITRSAISPDGNMVAYITDCFNERVHTHSKFNLRHLNEGIFHRYQSQGLKYCTMDHASKVLPGINDFHISWSPDSQHIGLLQKPLNYRFWNDQKVNRLHLIELTKNVSTHETMSPIFEYMGGWDYLTVEEDVLQVKNRYGKRSRKVKKNVTTTRIGASPDRDAIFLYYPEKKDLEITDRKGKKLMKISDVHDISFVPEAGLVATLNSYNTEDGHYMMEYKIHIYGNNLSKALWKDTYKVKHNRALPRIFHQPEVAE